MSTSRDQIFDAALKLSEAERLLLVSQLLDTLPEDLPGLADDSPLLLDELDRRARDPSPTIPVSELWKRN